VEKIWITKKIKGTGVKKSGNKKISKKYVKNYILVFSLLMLDFMGFFAYN